MGSTKSYHWLVRLTTDQVFDKMSEYFPDTLFGAYVAENEDGVGKRHYHLALTFKDYKTRNQLNKQITEFFPHHGNEYRSLKIWKSGNDLASDDFLQYMHKSARPVFWGTRIGLKTHEEYEHLAKQVSRAIKKHQTMLDDMLMEVADTVRSQLTHADLKDMPIYRLRQMVIDSYYDFHMTNKRRFKSDFHMKTDLVNIIALIGGETAVKSIKATMMNQLARFDTNDY